MQDELAVDELLSVQPSDDLLHESVELLELDSVQYSEDEVEHDWVLLVKLLAVEHDGVLGVELVLGVDQLLDSVDTNVLDEVRLDALLALD